MIRFIITLALLLPNLIFAQSRTISKVKEDFASAQYTVGLERLQALNKDANEKCIAAFFTASYFCISANPAYNLDSAYRQVGKCEQLFAGLTEKEKSSLCEDFTICQPRFMVIKDSLSAEIFKDLSNKKNLVGLQTFVKNYANEKSVLLAQIRIEELRFEQASNANDLLLLDQFLWDYPQTKYKNQINAQREELRYKQVIQIDALASYQAFLKDFPASKYKKELSDRMEGIEYANAKSVNNLMMYQQFLKQYPASAHKEEINGFIYQLRYTDLQNNLDIASIEAFLTEFPKAKHGAELQKKLEVLYFEQAKRVNTKMIWQEFIQKFPSSANLNEARSALAAFFTIVPYLNANGRMEFRDLQSNTQQFNVSFDMVYPFENNRAVVVDNGLYGLIDAQGKYVISLFYDDIKTYFNSELVVASKRKSGLQVYWESNSDDIYSDNWSADELMNLKNHLLSVSSYEAASQEELNAFRRYLGSLISKEYYSYSNFSYANDSEKFWELKERAENEFKQHDYYLYVFCKGPFSNKKVEVVNVYEFNDVWTAGSISEFPVVEYSLNGKDFVMAFVNGAFIEMGTTDHLLTYLTDEISIRRDGWFESEEAYNPGSFYLETKDGKRLTKQDFNEMSPLVGNKDYFLCHQGGAYAPYRGMMWETIGGKYGVINKNGQIILPFIFDQLYPVDSFAQHPYFVATINKVFPTEDNGYTETIGSVGLINLEGKELIPYTDGYNIIDFDAPNCILVTKNAVLGYYAEQPGESMYSLGGLTGVVDINRKVILPLDYNEIWPINHGQQFVVKKGMKLTASKEYPEEYTAIGGKYSLVNRSNQFLIPTPIDFLTSDLVGCMGCNPTVFGEAYNGKWGVLNAQGKTIIPFTYSEIYSTSQNGLYEVINGRTYKKSDYGYEIATEGKSGLNKNGTLMLPIKYDDLYVYESYIMGEIGKSKEYLQTNYQPFSVKLEELQEINGQLDPKKAIVAYRVGAKWGLLSASFQVITEPIFWGEISNEQNRHPFTYEKGFFIVNQGGQKFYVTAKGLVLKEGL